MLARLIAVFAALLLAMSPVSAVWAADDAPAVKAGHKKPAAKKTALKKTKAAKAKVKKKAAKADDDEAAPAKTKARGKSACASVKTRKGRRARTVKCKAASIRTPPKFAPYDSHIQADTPPPTAVPAAPVKVDDYQRHYEPPKGAGEAAYQAGIAKALQSAQQRLGPLEGSWTVTNVKTQKPVLSVVLSDPGSTEKVRDIEGAWRDMRDDDPSGDQGFFSKVSSKGEEIEIVFTRRGEDGPARLTLKRRPDGAYAGVLASQAGKTDVVMTRKSS